MQSVQTLAPTVLLAVALLGCDASQPWFGPRQVDVAAATRRPVPELADYPARLEPPARVDVYARTEGYLLERTFEDGTEVEQDRVLFLLQADAYEAALEQATGALELAEAALARADLAVRDSEVDADGAAGLARARAERDAAAARVRQRRAEAERAELDLAYTTLRAPIDGRIESHPVDVGNLVRVGDRLATIVQLDPIYASFDLDPAEAAALHNADRESPVVAMVVKAGGEIHDRVGRVVTIGGTIDPATGRVTVRALVPNPRTDLLAGQAVTVRLLLRWLPDAVVVPERAVHRDDGGRFVLLVGDDDRVERRTVRVGPSHGGERVIRGGIDEGDRVVVGRTRAAVPGRRVRAVPLEVAPRPTPALAPRVSPPGPGPRGTPHIDPARRPTQS